MTLAYENIPVAPPSKRWLIVLGALLFVPAAICCLMAPLMLTFLGFSAPGTSGLFPLFLAIAAMYFIAGSLIGWLAIGIVRARRWSRPFVLTISGFTALSMLASIPSFILIPIRAGTTSGPQLIGMIVGVGFALTFAVGLPLLYFFYFRKPTTREILEFYQPRPSWTDRWPVPVFAVGTIAALFTLTSALGILIAAGLAFTTLSAGSVINVVWQALATVWLIAIAFLCFRHRYLQAWTLAMAYILIAGLVTVLLGVVFPEITQRTAGLFNRGQPIETGGVLGVVQGAVVWVAFGIALVRMRPSFLAPPPALPTMNSGFDMLPLSGTAEQPSASLAPPPLPPRSDTTDGRIG